MEGWQERMDGSFYDSFVQFYLVFLITPPSEDVFLLGLSTEIKFPTEPLTLCHQHSDSRGVADGDMITFHRTQ